MVQEMGAYGNSMAVFDRQGLNPAYGPGAALNYYPQAPLSSYPPHQDYPGFPLNPTAETNAAQSGSPSPNTWANMYNTHVSRAPIDDWTAQTYGNPMANNGVSTSMGSGSGLLYKHPMSGYSTDYSPYMATNTGVPHPNHMGMPTHHQSPSPNSSTENMGSVGPAGPTGSGGASRQAREPFSWMKRQAFQTSTASGKTRTKDKYRIVYSEFQKVELEKEYLYSKYITIQRKAELSRSIGLSERQVKIWFQNRRAKERKQKRKREDAIANITNVSDMKDCSDSEGIKVEPHPNYSSPVNVPQTMAIAHHM